MKKAFYDWEKEVALLRATREKSKTSHSMMTVLTGRRRTRSSEFEFGSH
jgi:hypothetical protein